MILRLGRHLCCIYNKYNNGVETDVFSLYDVSDQGRRRTIWENLCIQDITPVPCCKIYAANDRGKFMEKVITEKSS